MRRGFTFVDLLVVIVVLGIVAAILFPVIRREDPDIPRRSSCQGNLRTIGLAHAQYTQDYGETYVPIASDGGVYGWADALEPYLKNRAVFQCPSEPNLTQQTVSARTVGYTDYWMNARLAGQRLAVIRNPSITLLAGDGNDDTDKTDARYAIRAFPWPWSGNSSSPLYRHLAGANMGFADGHVKWLTAAKLEALNADAPAGGTDFTFAIK